MSTSTHKLIRAGDFEEALSLAAAHPAALIEVFVGTWSEVDQDRAQAAALGLAGRIGVHHRSALDALVALDVLPGPPTGTASRAFLQHMDAFVRAAAAALQSRFAITLSR